VKALNTVTAMQTTNAATGREPRPGCAATSSALHRTRRIGLRVAGLLLFVLGISRDAHALWNLTPPSISPLTGTRPRRLSGGRMTSVVVDPTNIQYAVASANFGGIYVTLDGGFTWHSSLHDNGTRGDYGLGFEGSGAPNFLQVAVNRDASVFLALVGPNALVSPANPTPAQSGIWRSTDKGKNWSRASGNPVPVPYDVTKQSSGIAFSSLNGNAYATAGDQLGISTDGAADSWMWLDPLGTHAASLTGMAVFPSTSAFGDNKPSDEVAFCAEATPAAGTSAVQMLGIYDVQGDRLLQFPMPSDQPDATCSVAFDPNDGRHLFLARVKRPATPGGQQQEKIYEGDITPGAGGAPATIMWNDLGGPQDCMKSPPGQCMPGDIPNGRPVFVRTHGSRDVDVVGSRTVDVYYHDSMRLYRTSCSSLTTPACETVIDGESTWSLVPSVHTDVADVAFDPSTSEPPCPLLLAGDGGMERTTDCGGTWNGNIAGLHALQPHDASFAYANANHLLDPSSVFTFLDLQDDGIIEGSPSQGSAAGSGPGPTLTHLNCGDGFWSDMVGLFPKAAVSRCNDGLTFYTGLDEDPLIRSGFMFSVNAAAAFTGPDIPVPAFGRAIWPKAVPGSSAFISQTRFVAPFIETQVPPGPALTTGHLFLSFWDASGGSAGPLFLPLSGETPGRLYDTTPTNAPEIHMAVTGREAPVPGCSPPARVYMTVRQPNPQPGDPEFSLFVYTVQGDSCPAVSNPWTEMHYDPASNPNFPREPRFIWGDGNIYSDGFDGDRVYVSDSDASIWSIKDGTTVHKETGLAVLANDAATVFGVTTIAFDPTNHDRIAVGTRHHGVLVSMDAGQTWATSADNVPQPNASVTALFVYPGLGEPTAIGGHCPSYAPNQLAPGCEDAWAAVSGQGLWAIKLRPLVRFHIKPGSLRHVALSGVLVDSSGNPIGGSDLRVQIFDKNLLSQLGTVPADADATDTEDQGSDDPSGTVDDGGAGPDVPPTVDPPVIASGTLTVPPLSSKPPAPPPVPTALLADYVLANATDASGAFQLIPPALSVGNYYVLVTVPGSDIPLTTAGMDDDVTSSCNAANGPCFATPGEWTSHDAALTPGAGPLGLTGQFLEVALPRGPSSYTLTSATFSTVGLITGNTLSFDLYNPANPPNPFWLGDVQAYISIPSAGIYHQWIGIVLLNTVPLGTFGTVSFRIPAATVSALSGHHNDVSVSLQLDVAQGSGPYFLQNFEFTSAN
jgi:hypothetical protein